jgi:nicotinate-nucleotide--dimethylbenzimidazole phosphoribosyltransferase
MSQNSPKNGLDYSEILLLLEGLKDLPDYDHPHPPQNPPELKDWLKTCRVHKLETALHHPRLCLFTADHYQGNDLERHATSEFLKQLTNPASAIAVAAKMVDADLRAYDLNDADTPPAFLSEIEITRALSYGMMAVEPGLDILAIAGFGAGSDAAALSILANKKANLDTLKTHGTYAMAAIAGAIIAARFAQCPVILEGYTALAALHCLKGHAHHLEKQCINAYAVPEYICLPTLNDYGFSETIKRTLGLISLSHIAQLKILSYGF